MEEIRYRPIGVIHTPHKEPAGVPIQPAAAAGVEGRVEVFPEYLEGLSNLEDFSHIILVYRFHLAKKPASLKVRPYMDEKEHGVFTTRAPSRPNPIGISVVKLLRIEGNILYVENMDIVDGTPLLDIKPYVPEFDEYSVEKIGWLAENVGELSNARDDGRFHER